jgi:Na+/proline symporter
MHLTLIDWLVIAGYFAINLAIGLWYRRRATGSTEEYFVSGRNVSWWLAGCTMIYLTLFGIGKIIFGHWQSGLVFLVCAAAAGGFVYWDLNRRGWKVLDDEPSNTKS